MCSVTPEPNCRQLLRRLFSLELATRFGGLFLALLERIHGVPLAAELDVGDGPGIGDHQRNFLPL